MCGPRDIEHKQGISCQYPPSWIIMSMLSESGYSRRGFYGVCEADGGGSAWGGFEVDEFLGIRERWEAKVIPGVVLPMFDVIMLCSLCALLFCAFPPTLLWRPQGSRFIPLVFLLGSIRTYHTLKILD